MGHITSAKVCKDKALLICIIIIIIIIIIVTLAVLDVGGGVLAPIASSIVDYIEKDPLFRSCKEAWWNFGTPFIEGQTKLEDMSELQIKSLLKAKKTQVMREFSGNLPTDHKILPLLRKAKF